MSKTYYATWKQDKQRLSTEVVADNKTEAMKKVLVIVHRHPMPRKEERFKEGTPIKLKEIESVSASPTYNRVTKKSNRKKPIAFKRKSTSIHAPKTSSSVGPGRGWHGESRRHSMASVVGWARRRR